MREELEQLKQKVLVELKEKSIQLEKEADDLVQQRTHMERVLS
jgi:hypothetical protein